MTWTHACCWSCWDEKYPDMEPYRVIGSSATSCCFCGLTTISGIFVRHDPKDQRLFCKGVHEDEC